MSDYNLSYKEYNALYARFLKRTPDDLFKIAGLEDLKGKRVLDLCAGTLRASQVAFEMGASEIHALDESDKALPVAYSYLTKFHHISIQRFLCSKLKWVTHPKFDVVICQQGINYWFSDSCIKLLAKHFMSKKGVFIFNTFNTKPNTKPKLTETSKTSWECSFCDEEDIIHHWQIQTGQNPHQTSFYWVDPTSIEKILKRYFKQVERHTQDKTDIYVCRINKGDKNGINPKQ